jgi:hypothetical protein
LRYIQDVSGTEPEKLVLNRHSGFRHRKSTPIAISVFSGFLDTRFFPRRSRGEQLFYISMIKHDLRGKIVSGSAAFYGPRHLENSPSCTILVHTKVFVHSKALKIWTENFMKTMRLHTKIED